jgi:hypothetical protein
MKLKKIDWLFLGSLLLFLIIKISQLRFKFSDGYTYMYMGKLILEGLIPYKDFFFASPPFQSYLMAFAMIFINKNFILLKLIPIFFTLGSAFFIYSFMKKKFSDKQGLVASTLFLFSYLILLTTDYSTGIHITTFFILGMIYFLEFNKPIIAGIFASLAMLTRLYAPFPIVGAGLYLLIYRKNQFWKFATAAILPFAIISIIFQIISNGNYLDQIFFFRLNLITGIGLSKLNILKFFFLSDIILILGSIAWLIFNKNKKQLLLPILTFLSTAILYVIYSDIYYLYFGLIIGTMAIFTTQFIFNFKNKKQFKKILTIFLIILIILTTVSYIKNHATAANINFIDEATNFIKANSLENQTIYGHFSITLLLSLKSGRRLAGNIADTNPKNTMTHTITEQEIINKIKPVKFIITKTTILPNNQILGFDSSIPINYLKQNCNIVKTYSIKKDYSDNTVIIWNCENQIPNL